MIKVYATYNENGPAILDIKGIRIGWQWIYTQLSIALCYRVDGTLTLDFASTDLPSSIIKRINLIQSAGV